MKSKISALMDGELMQAEQSEPLRALREEGEALEAWRAYHLISDSLQETPILSIGFSARFAERLALEPTILAPASIRPQAVTNPYRIPLSAAASVAAVALVGWFAIQGSGSDAGPKIRQRTRDGPHVRRSQRLPACTPELFPAKLVAGRGALRADCLGIGPRKMSIR